MAKKDRRIKGCPNVNCPDFMEKKKYGTDDHYCRKCGTPLVFVCAKCYRPLKDIEGLRICPDCKGKPEKKVTHAAKKAGKTVKKKAEQGAFIVKQKAPEALETAKVLARDKNVRRAATIVAVTAAETVKNPKVKKIAKIVIKAVR
ncbi:MAG: hypothetical protein IKE74_08620 [Mogibacterium sp.]|nr:hypothetical protein [Mogibacterium sp.]